MWSANGRRRNLSDLVRPKNSCASCLQYTCPENMSEVQSARPGRRSPRRLKRSYPMLIIFGTNIPDTTGHRMTVQVLTSPSVCFCSTWEKEQAKWAVMNKKTSINFISPDRWPQKAGPLQGLTEFTENDGPSNYRTWNCRTKIYSINRDYITMQCAIFLKNVKTQVRTAS